MKQTKKTQLVPRESYLVDAATTASLWESEKKVELIKNTFCVPQQLSDLEVQTFLEIGKRTGLNPFLRELWAVKYDRNRPANIFVGRDGYRKSAQAHPDYDGHIVIAVYENDEYYVENNIPFYKGAKYAERGRIIGAYCSVKRKNISRDFFVFVDFGEYTSNQALWRSKPATMIKKVAESQALRMAFQELFAGTYAEEEQWEVPKQQNTNLRALEEPTISVEEAIFHLMSADSLDSLKILFTNYSKQFKSQPALLERIIDAKDKKKDQLEQGGKDDKSV